ncbi:glycoside hydrolase, partial [Acinetobacter puyangensis]
PSIGLLVACKYWLDNGLNALADKDDVTTITRRINGGLNGFDDRKSKLAIVKGWFK